MGKILFLVCLGFLFSCGGNIKREGVITYKVYDVSSRNLPEKIRYQVLSSKKGLLLEQTAIIVKNSDSSETVVSILPDDFNQVVEGDTVQYRLLDDNSAIFKGKRESVPK